MSRKPQLEEVDDDESEQQDLELAQLDPTLKTPIAPVHKPVITRSQDLDDFDPPVEVPQPVSAPRKERNAIVDPEKFSAEDREHLKKFQVLYPCYFDKNRSHNEGRRVSAENAVENPLAKTISDACRQLNLPVLLELDKSHPQDFGNPGRVRVLIKDAGVAGDSRVPTKRALLNLVSGYLKSHPTTLSSIGKASGIPFPTEFEEGFTPEEIPKVKGFKMNTIAPVHSNLTIKHPMTKLIYDPEPEQAEAPKLPKQPKKKIMRVRG